LGKTLILDVNQLSINYSGRELFSPITFTVDSNEVLVLMGISGIGKTSIINAIAGNINYNGSIKSAKNFTVFQDSHQLFPWFTIKQNLDLVCDSKYMETIVDWDLLKLLNCYPNNISGGQRQRLTLIRAMYSGCNLLLCDEPLSGLDAVNRYFVLKDIKTKISELKLSCIWITHDLEEAKCIGNKIKLLTTNHFLDIERDITYDEFIKKLG
jgi:ABC-type nitrate/sulfonate/bicarbonate transport system ATPase subunit